MDDFQDRAKTAIAESDRFFLVRDRDGLPAAVAWAKRTITIYQKAVANPSHHTAKEPYRCNVERSIGMLKAIVKAVAEGKIDEETSWDKQLASSIYLDSSYDNTTKSS